MCSIFAVVKACVRVLSSWIKPRNGIQLHTTILRSFSVFYCADMSKWSHARDMPKTCGIFLVKLITELLVVPKEIIRKKKKIRVRPIFRVGRVMPNQLFLRPNLVLYRYMLGTPVYITCTERWWEVLKSSCAVVCHSPAHPSCLMYI